MANNWSAPRSARRYALMLRLRVLIRKFRRRLAPAKSQPVLVEDTTTENISSTGCYFLLAEEPDIRDKVEMEITIRPVKKRARSAKAICRGQVVRVDKGRPDGRVGVACTIDHYRLHSSSSMVACPESLHGLALRQDTSN